LLLFISNVTLAQNDYVSDLGTDNLYGSESVDDNSFPLNAEIVSALFPNPANTSFNFTFSGKEDAVLYIRITNEIGLLVQDKLIDSPESFGMYQIDISDLPVGTYNISFQQGKENRNQKLNILK
jgi:hypothetical protein